MRNGLDFGFGDFDLNDFDGLTTNLVISSEYLATRDLTSCELAASSEDLVSNFVELGVGLETLEKLLLETRTSLNSTLYAARYKLARLLL